ncbi:MAG TPA: glycosyltransferase [Solirubrobacteraceae bacterium]|jgi:glycosyltransferase involved in cell wall biosynthesis|nr:glycosyltransferase [Solirubrobacteraceae bacterium]
MPARIAVAPATALEEHALLFSALGSALGVRFTASRDGASAIVAIGCEPVRRDLPALELPVAADCAASRHDVEFPDDPSVPRALRGRRLEETGPRIVRDGVSSYPLPHLRPGETLRDHFRPGRFMALLQLLMLIGLPEPRLRACVILDDPNLHWPSYGRVDYRRLCERARSGGYHVALATVPRDAWLVNRRAAAIVRDRHLSLLVHGNDHTSHELGRLSDRPEAERAMAQALRRIAALEHRARVAVDRVMAPPHERCSEEALGAMLAVGFEAACIGRPQPWRDSEPPVSPLLGWRPAEFVAGGLPVIPRHSLHRARDELVFRALLGQPLVLYGHHADTELLDDSVAYVNGLGDVEWGSIGSIARSNYTAARDGEMLVVEGSSRRLTVEVPDGVRSIRFATAPLLESPRWAGLRVAGRLVPLGADNDRVISEPVEVGAARRVELELVPSRQLDPRRVRSPRPRAWPLVRRLLSESRDRVRGAVTPERGRVVMLLQNNPYPEDTRVRNEAETLAGAGHHVTVIAPRGDEQARSGSVDGVRVRRYRAPLSGGSVGGYVWEYAVAHLKLSALGLGELVRGARIVHVHGPPDSLAVVGAAGRVLGRRAVFDLHDSAPELFAAKFGDGRAGRALAGAQRAAVLSADLVIVTNESQRQLASSLGGTRVAVVRNGPRAAEFAKSLAPPRPGTLREPNLVYVGALDVQDGVLELAELLSDPALRDARLTVVGDGPLAGELAARCDQLGLDGRVALLGRVPHEQVPELIAKADIGVDPAPGTELNHGSTMIKVAEYLAVGRPVVAYRLRETERTALDAGVYAPCGDREAFAELVRSLADDGARRLALSERARQRSSELMWERSAEALCNAYAGLA